MLTRTHPLAWIVEPLQDRADYQRRSMFGCEAVYLRGRIVLALTARSEPWNGLLCPTERHHHESMLREFPLLAPHPVLPKWLYLSAGHDTFESTALEIVDCILRGDVRFGVEPPPRTPSPRVSSPRVRRP
ncbi:MAG: hypothetical protein JO061_19055 [Acidobacteriaceae bacterium]|nr:hypothetical protein [Acidobacteriaceae bacterium]